MAIWLDASVTCRVAEATSEMTSDMLSVMRAKAFPSTSASPRGVTEAVRSRAARRSAASGHLGQVGLHPHEGRAELVGVRPRLDVRREVAVADAGGHLGDPDQVVVHRDERVSELVALAQRLDGRGQVAGADLGRDPAHVRRPRAHRVVRDDGRLGVVEHVVEDLAERRDLVAAAHVDRGRHGRHLLRQVALAGHRVQPGLKIGQAVVAEAAKPIPERSEPAGDPPRQQVGDRGSREHRDDDEDDRHGARRRAVGMELGHCRLPAGLGLVQECVELRGQRVDRLVGGIHELERLVLAPGPHRRPHLRVDAHEVGEGRLDLGKRCTTLRVGRVAVRLGEHLAERADVGQEVLAARGPTSTYLVCE